MEILLLFGNIAYSGLLINCSYCTRITPLLHALQENTSYTVSFYFFFYILISFNSLLVVAVSISFCKIFDRYTL